VHRSSAAAAQHQNTHSISSTQLSSPLWTTHKHHRLGLSSTPSTPGFPPCPPTVHHWYTTALVPLRRWRWRAVAARAAVLRFLRSWCTAGAPPSPRTGTGPVPAIATQRRTAGAPEVGQGQGQRQEKRIGYTVKVLPWEDRGQWEGWGTSVAWWGVAVGDDPQLADALSL